MSKLFAVIVLVSLGLFAPIQTYAEPIAIVVNKQNLRNEISLKDLARIFNLCLSRWEDGQKILPVHGMPSSKIREDFYRIALATRADQSPTALCSKDALTPINIPDAETSQQFVGNMPNAIAYVYAHNISDSVKVLKVEGYLPSQSGYPLK